MMMSTRLQVVMDEAELDAYRRCAKREGKTLSEWVRDVLRRAKRARREPSPEEKLAALDRALELGDPTANLEEMLEEMLEEILEDRGLSRCERAEVPGRRAP